MSAAEVVLAAFGLLTAAAAVLSVTSRRVVHCALWLVVALGALAGVYLVLGAEVVALVQLLVYVGAVVVLVLFALMLTRAPVAASRDLDAPPGQRLAGALAGLAVALLVGGSVLLVVGGRTLAVDRGRGSPQAVGEAVFAGWVLPFELLSVLLLAALVGALAISRAGSPGDRTAAAGATGAGAVRGGTPGTGSAAGATAAGSADAGAAAGTAAGAASGAAARATGPGAARTGSAGEGGA